jgi:hypothetical protein
LLVFNARSGLSPNFEVSCDDRHDQAGTILLSSWETVGNRDTWVANAEQRLAVI